MDGQSPAGQSQARRPPLVLLCLLALGTMVSLVPFHARYATPETLNRFLLIYGLHTALVLALLIAGVTTVGRRHRGGLILCLVLGVAANLELYTYLLPYAVPTYPSLTASLLSLLLVSGAVALDWRVERTLVVSVVVCAGFALVAVMLGRQGLPVGPFGLALGVLLVGATIAVASAHVLERSRAELEERERALADLSAHLMSVQEEERRHLARELHEELGQSITAMLSYLYLIEKRDAHDIDAIHSDAAAARAVGSQTLAEMRRLSQGLRPPALDVCGLVPALEACVKAFGEREHLATTFAATGLPERLPPHLEVALYRVTQEALGNVVSHGKASHVDVNLALQGSELRLEVLDDGVETQKEGANGGPGLIAIGERARALGGSVGLQSARGTRLTVSVPISPRSADGNRRAS